MTICEIHGIEHEEVCPVNGPELTLEQEQAMERTLKSMGGGISELSLLHKFA